MGLIPQRHAVDLQLFPIDLLVKAGCVVAMSPNEFQNVCFERLPFPAMSLRYQLEEHDDCG
jgi:hypothetical protein